MRISPIIIGQQTSGGIVAVSLSFARANVTQQSGAASAGAGVEMVTGRGVSDGGAAGSLAESLAAIVRGDSFTVGSSVFTAINLSTALLSSVVGAVVSSGGITAGRSSALAVDGAANVDAVTTLARYIAASSIAETAGSVYVSVDLGLVLSEQLDGVAATQAAQSLGIDFATIYRTGIDIFDSISLNLIRGSDYSGQFSFYGAVWFDRMEGANNDSAATGFGGVTASKTILASVVAGAVALASRIDSVNFGYSLETGVISGTIKTNDGRTISIEADSDGFLVNARVRIVKVEVE